MDDEAHNKIISFYKKRIEPFVALFVLAFLITACFLVWQDNQLKKEISKNCGYETKDYTCYCEKKITDQIKFKINNDFGLGEIENVSMDW